MSIIWFILLALALMAGIFADLDEHIRTRLDVAIWALIILLAITKLTNA